ncbi:hypothetical protein [Devosia nitrariae]|nr:hypothetical protein [Devosia nitrariae]
MGKINKQWHEAHKLARNATLDERIDWHVKHAANCACRPIPRSILDELERRGLLEPSALSLR